MTTLPDHPDSILIIDFGSQVTQLIARRLRELNVYCEIHPFQKVTDAYLDEAKPKAVILSGGPASVFSEGAPLPPQKVFELGVPVLGICYGQQAMMHLLGGKVESGHMTAEFGRAFVTPKNGKLDLLDGWFETEREQVWMSHGDHVSEIAPGFEVYGTSPNAPFAVTADVERHFYAVQFHPEVHHTPHGKKLYENFVTIAGCKRDWTMGAYREEAIAKIREQVGDRKVICGLSGGVDSSVAAVLLHEAIGDQLTCVFVDHGLLRLNEGEEVVTMFRDHYNMQLIHAQEQDLDRAEAQQVTFPPKPATENFYVDEAGLIAQAEGQAINEVAGALLRDDQVPIIVVTISSLTTHNAAGYTIESVGFTGQLRNGTLRFNDAIESRDVNQFSASVGLRWQAHPRLLAGLTLTNGDDEARTAGSDYSRDLTAVRGSLTWRAHPMVQINSSVGFLNADYPDPFFGMKREDEQLSISLGASWAGLLPSGWVFSPSARYTDPKL